MRSHRGSRSSVVVAARDMSPLSSALAWVQHLTGANKIAMARKIGFAVGLDLASRRPPCADIHSEVSSLFRRLNLGKVILREWEPLVFVTRSGFQTESLEAAFGEGLLEGLVRGRKKERVFVSHSIPLERRRIRSQTGLRGRSRRVIQE